MRTDGRADRRTDEEIDMTKLIVAFRNFESAPKNFESISGTHFNVIFDIIVSPETTCSLCLDLQ